MSNNGKKNGKKKGALGTIATLLVVVILYLFSGSQDGEQGNRNTPDIQNTIQTQSDYESQENTDSLQDATQESSEKTTEQSTEQSSEQSTEQNVEQTTDQSMEQTTEAVENEKEEQEETPAVTYSFRNEGLLESHYEKHGIEMGFDSAEEYEAAASRVVNNPDALYKLEAEDNDHVYYLEETNEFVVVSRDGYIRTYFLPSRGIDYFNAQ